MSKLTVQKVEQFISGVLHVALTKDLQSHMMVREADLECCLYFHVRRFLSRCGDTDWRVFARKHVKADIQDCPSRFIDFTITQNGMARVAIELKWNAKSMGVKDRASLNACLSDWHFQKVYFITTLYPGSSYKSVANKNNLEKHNLFEVLVQATGDREAWLAERKKYKTLVSRQRKPSMKKLAMSASAGH